MRIRYDPNDANYLEIEIQGEPLLEDKTYIVASTDFEFSELINYLVIPDEQVEYELPTIMPEVLEDYIRQNSPLRVPEVNRFTSHRKRNF